MESAAEDVDISDGAATPAPTATPLPHAPVKWKNPRFQPAIDSVRSACGFVTADREDDPMIGMCAHSETHTKKPAACSALARIADPRASVAP